MGYVNNYHNMRRDLYKLDIWLNQNWDWPRFMLLSPMTASIWNQKCLQC